jgi:disulfide bond formation protein DsbB
MSKDEQNDEILRHALRIEWDDHFQTRKQTWKTLEIAAILLAGFIVVDWRFQNLWLMSVLAVLLLYTSISGVVVSWHHRKAQIRKFQHIDRLEEALGLHKPGLLDDVRPPRPFRPLDVLNLPKMSTPLFILRMHLAFLVFLAVYVIARFTIE